MLGKYPEQLTLEHKDKNGWTLFILVVRYGHHGGEAGNLHPGLWKIPPRLLENPTQGSGKLQNLHEPCDYTFLDKQVSEEKFKKLPHYVEIIWTIFMYA